MGMSASQARLLSITARLNDVEFKSQSIANTKIRLADESEQLAMKYTQALNQQKYQLTTYGVNGEQKIDLTLASLSQLDSKYKLVTRDGKRVVTESQYISLKSGADNAKDVATVYNRYQAGNVKKGTWEYSFITNKDIVVRNAATIYAIEMVTNRSCHNCDDVNVAGLQDIYNSDEYKKYFDEYILLANTDITKDGKGIFMSAKTTVNAVSVDPSIQNDPAWLYNAIESGEFMLVDAETGEEVTASTEIQLSPVTDNSNFAKAEAEYNAANMKINNKEKLLDNELKKLDTEHNALQTESDSIKDLISKNIEKSFSLFS